MNILLLSAYDAASHRRWRESLVAQFPEHQWTPLVLAARHFAWRVRGNAITWGLEQLPTLSKNYHLMITTSMCDLASLRGLVPSLADIPTIVYFHENQFDYPLSSQSTHSIEPQICSIYTSLAGDRLVFNSNYNKMSFLEGVDQFLKKMPDGVPPGIRASLQIKSRVIPVPLSQSCFKPSMPCSPSLQLVWNHRWEYDKGPDRLLAMLHELLKLNIDFRLSVLGQQFRKIPAEFAKIKTLVGNKLAHFGYVDSIENYQKILQQNHMVLSTAIHDFQGLAILDGIACNCVPIVPNRLAYPELIPSAYRYASYPTDINKEAKAMANNIALLWDQRAHRLTISPPTIENLSWSHLKTSYQELIDEMTGNNSDPDTVSS